MERREKELILPTNEIYFLEGLPSLSDGLATCVFWKVNLLLLPDFWHPKALRLQRAFGLSRPTRAYKSLCRSPFLFKVSQNHQRLTQARVLPFASFSDASASLLLVQIPRPTCCPLDSQGLYISHVPNFPHERSVSIQCPVFIIIVVHWWFAPVKGVDTLCKHHCRGDYARWQVLIYCCFTTAEFHYWPSIWRILLFCH